MPNGKGKTSTQDFRLVRSWDKAFLEYTQQLLGGFLP